MRSILALAALWTLGLLAGCKDEPPATPVPRKILEVAAVPLDGTGSASATLSDGASMLAAPGAMTGPGELALLRAALPAAIPDVPPGVRLFGDVYIPGVRGSPRFTGDLRLTIPIAKLPDGVAVQDVRAYEFAMDRYILPRDARLDPSGHALVIDNPEVSHLDVPQDAPRFRKPDTHARTVQSPAGAHPPTGIVLGSGPPTPAMSSSVGTAVVGEVYQEPGKDFRIIFEVAAPRSLATQISRTLQTTADLYRKEYKIVSGNLARCRPANPMKVYVGDYSDNGEYLPWSDTGWMKIGSVPALKSATGLDETLCHELFHAVQSSYFNMMAAGNRGYWWFEATAEWAGLRALGMTLEGMIRHDIRQRYQYALSVPIASSADKQYEGGNLLSYAYCTLIEHVESHSPGYVNRVFADPNRSSGSDELWKQLVAEGDLTHTYLAFVQQAMKFGFPDLWPQARVIASDKQCRSYSRPTDRLGDNEMVVERKSFADYQFVERRRKVAPMTLRVYSVTHDGLSEPCSVTVHLTETAGPRGHRPSDQALLLAVPRGGAGNTAPAPSRLSVGGSTVSGLGKAHETIWVVVFNDDATRDLDYELTIEIGRKVGPTQLASRIDEDRTAVAFHDDALATLLEGGRLRYRLYRSTSPDGPWLVAGETEVTRFEGNFTRTQGRSSGPDSFEFDTRGGSGAHEPRPDFYKVCRVVPMPGGKDVEISSDVLPPSGKANIELTIDRNRGEPAIVGHGCKRKVWPDVVDSQFNGLFPLHAALALENQFFLHPGAHFVVEWNGHKRHFWTGRTEGEPAFTYGDEEGLGLAWLPSTLGSATLTIEGESVDGRRSKRDLVVVYDPEWAQARRVAAQVSIDDDPAVKELIAPGEAAPANVQKLEAELAKETIPERRRQLRRTVLQEELMGLKLEEARLHALLDRARRSRAACDWRRALEIVRTYLVAQSDYGTRFLAWMDRDAALEDEEDPSPSLRKSRASHKASMGNWVLKMRLEALVLAMEYANPAGDYPTLSLCAQTLIAEHPKLPSVLAERQSAQTFADLPWLRKQLALGTAALTGDRGLAASQGMPAGMDRERLAWWPSDSESIKPAEPPSPGALEKLQQDWKHASEELQKLHGLRIKPGA